MLPAASATLYSVGTSLAAGTELAEGVRHGAERGGGGGFFLFPLLLLLLAGFLFFRIMRRGRYAAYAMNHGAMGTLSDRFARGEISRDEFEYRRAVLNKDKDVPPAPPFARPATDESVAQDPVGGPQAPEDGPPAT